METNTVVKKYMNPYLAGFLLGLVILASFYVAGQGLGASGAPKRILASVMGTVAHEYAMSNGEFGHYLKEGNPLNNWLVYEMLGVFFGAFLSGALAGRLKLKIDHSPKITSKTRLTVALIGGTLFGFGSAMGRGCTSGAGLSAMASFSLSGFVAVAGIFGTGYIVSYFLRKFWI